MLKNTKSKTSDSLRTLSEILSEIDKIEDDEEFCREEYETVRDFCEKKEFAMSKSEMDIISSRGLMEAFYDWKERSDEEA